MRLPNIRSSRTTVLETEWQQVVVEINIDVLVARLALALAKCEFLSHTSTVASDGEER